ncbi:phage gp6-like head-tail connector protein [Streptomyces sp. NPDC059070]|uniref:phage gp6-like head-tail connector protein n=1 Tax=Streptomyces sp. NPDC059070 TaxID=3346713 RepID=UPI0036B3CE5D
MPSLATTDDVAARMGRPPSDDERPRIAAFLIDVSALVVDYCGTDFRHHDDGLVQLDPLSGIELPLPRFMLPLTSVTEVRWGDGTPIEDWSYSRRSLWRAGGWQPPARGKARTITVRASYGYLTTPPTVTAVVCTEVIRWLAVQPGITAEKVGELETHYGTAAPTQSLSPAAEQALRSYRRRVTSTHVRRAYAL